MAIIITILIAGLITAMLLKIVSNKSMNLNLFFLAVAIGAAILIHIIKAIFK
ncbi:hypothetical protein [Furfurilactobacillus entadae]|uniref:hypothetical protein n=1 Tax=Furfurilactobacillus entadae TaxID=2922307 RepID=UPI0038B40999